MRLYCREINPGIDLRGEQDELSCDKEIQREAQFDGNSSEKGNYYRQHVSLNCILQSHRMPSMEKSCNLIAILSFRHKMNWNILRLVIKDYF